MPRSDVEKFEQGGEAPIWKVYFEDDKEYTLNEVLAAVDCKAARDELPDEPVTRLNKEMEPVQLVEAFEEIFTECDGNQDGILLPEERDHFARCIMKA